MKQLSTVGRTWICAFIVGVTPWAMASQALPAADNPALEKRVQAITSELRCLVCQNQTIADSHADLAVDLRNQVRDMLAQGRTDAEILEFMTQRYGDFVLYRPPVRGSTWLLWFGPFVMAVAGVLVLLAVLRRRSRLPADQFDPEPADPSLTAAPAATNLSLRNE